MRTYKELREQYGVRFTRILYIVVPKEWWDKNGTTPATHPGAVMMAAITMVCYKLDLTPEMDE
jgi:hypothetical protein